MTVVRHPPGRTGRLWLRRRLATAEHGCDELSRKLRVLLQELDRVRSLGDDARRTWAGAVEEAWTWQLRAGVLGGQEAYAGGPAVDPVTVTVEWAGVAGVPVPTGVKVPDPPDGSASPTRLAGNTAVVVATSAFADALQAAARLAVLQEADRRIADQVAQTRRKVRALEHHWLPALRASLADLEQSLEAQEQEEAVRLRRAVALATDRAETQQPPADVMASEDRRSGR